jgi:phage terminase Nu1 subunit (DNA packaging protein)
MHEYTVNKIAEMFEKDRNTIARALRSVPADAGPPKRPLYRLATAVKALIAYEVKPDGRHGNGDSARLAAARTELAREQAETARLKNEATRGRLVPKDMVIRAGSIVFAAFRERCLAIPGKVAAPCEMRLRGEVEAIVRDEVYEALEVLSQPIIPLDGSPWLGERDAVPGDSEQEIDDESEASDEADGD